MRDIRALVKSIALPAVHLMAADTPSRSHFGGSPNLPTGVACPEHRGRKLDLIARVSLSQLQQRQALNWLPATGALLFFYDTHQQPWGFDPLDRGAAAVLLVPDLEQPVSDSANTVNAGGDGLSYRPLDVRALQSHPSPHREAVVALGLDDEESDEYHDLYWDGYQALPKHQIAGFPLPIQNDNMELEAQLASNDVYCGNRSGFESPEAKRLQAGASDWRLLAQFDSDDGLMNWGDSGMVYFWVREPDARAGDFTNIWLILQCH